MRTSTKNRKDEQEMVNAVKQYYNNIFVQEQSSQSVSGRTKYCDITLKYNGVYYHLEAKHNNDYDNSDVKKVVDNWSIDKFNDELVYVDGYKVRLVTLEDLIDNLGYTFDNRSTSYSISSDEKFDWLHEYSYWTMIYKEDSSLLLASYEVTNDDEYDYDSYFGEIAAYRFSKVRPVINLSKCVLGDQDEFCLCEKKPTTKKITKYNSYNIGDEIEYKGEKYYVIQNSSKSENYVTLLKKDILTSDEISKYTNGKYDTKNVPYYISNTCTSESNRSGCTNEYEKSIPKTIINNWANDKLDIDDLIEINGYKIRLVTVDELFKSLGYSHDSIITYTIYKLTENVPNWLYNSDYQYWTMGTVEDYDSFVYIIFNDGIVSGTPGSDSRGYEASIFCDSAVRPVINLNKCAIDGGCYEEEYQAEECVDSNDDIANSSTNNSKLANSNQKVTVANPLKKVSNVVLIISLLLIIGGVIVLLINYNKVKKK